jgi:hypothetical protein
VCVLTVLPPQGLQWMLNREQLGGASAQEGVLRLDPRWVQLVAPSGATFYMERLAPWSVSTTFVPAPVPTICGGFLCDEVRAQPAANTPTLNSSQSSEVAPCSRSGPLYTVARRQA